MTMILKKSQLVVLLCLTGALLGWTCRAQEQALAAPDATVLKALAAAIAAARAQPTNGVLVGRLKDLIPRAPAQMGLRESLAFAVAVGMLASGDDLGFEVQRQKLPREYPDSPSRSLLDGANFDEPCPACKGEGKQFWKCTKCNGSGKCGNAKCEAGVVRYKGLNREMVEKPCPVCGGTAKCTVCKGTGKQSQVCDRCGGKGKRKAKGRARDLFVAALDQCAELLGQVRRSIPAPGDKVLTPVAAAPDQPEPADATAREATRADDADVQNGILPPPPAELDATAVDEWLLPPPEKPIDGEPVAAAQATPAAAGEPALALPPPPDPEPEDTGKTPEHLRPLLDEYGKWLTAQQRRIGARIVTKVRVEEQDGNRAVLHLVLHKNFFSQSKGWRTQVADAFCKLWAEKCLGYQVDGQQLVPATVLEDEKGEVVGEATGPNADVKLKR
jgi:hypothetical protein